MVVRKKFGSTILTVLLLSMIVSGVSDAQKSSIDIQHYQINLDLSDLPSKQIAGFADIQLITIEFTDTLFFDLLKMHIDSIWVDEDRVQQYEYNDTILSIPIDITPPGVPIITTIFYHGTPVRDPSWGGFYFDEEFAYNMGVGFNMIPHAVGRVWYPCLDGFTDRATYEYFIEVEDGYMAVCSGELMEILEIDNGHSVFYWSLKAPIPTYLSSIAVGKYKVLRDTLDGMKRPVPVSIFVPEADLEKASGSFITLGNIFKAFEHYFGPYRWQRIGFVSVPFFGGAMEHATNISLSASTITGDLDHVDLYAHELAHSWFGNLVTCESTKDMWLNEGMASYAEALYHEHDEGPESYKGYIRKTHTAVLNYAHRNDKGYLALYDPPEGSVYGTTVYDKGSLVAHNLRQYLGDNRFFPILKTYFRDHAFSSISTEAFIAYFSKKGGINLDHFAETWIYQPGFPDFELDDMIVNRGPGVNSVGISISQRLKGGASYAWEQPVEVTFMDNHWNSLTREIIISGEQTDAVLELPIAPTAVFLDLNEKLADASPSVNHVINRSGTFDFKDVYAALKVEALVDSALLQITGHWLPPEGIDSIYHVAGHYWRVSLLMTAKMEAQLSFLLPPGATGNNLPEGNKKRKKTLLYKPESGEKWIEIDHRVDEPEGTPVLSTMDVKSGFYAIAFR